MTVVTEFFEHINFGGRVNRITTPTDWRWQWVTFGGNWNDIVSSIRTNVVSGRPANVYAFQHIDFAGRFASLNVPSGWTCQFGALGNFNDQVSSALIIRRDPREIVLQLRSLIIPDFIADFDRTAAGTAVSRKGDPSIQAIYNPAHDRGAMLVRIHQNMNVALECWSDYDAAVSFDLAITLGGQPIDGFCKWVSTWVESGPFSSQVFDRLHPRMMQAGRDFTSKLRQKLGPINETIRRQGIQLYDVYILPGNQPAFPPPNGNIGRYGDAGENCCVVFARR